MATLKFIADDGSEQDFTVVIPAPAASPTEAQVQSAVDTAVEDTFTPGTPGATPDAPTPTA